MDSFFSSHCIQIKKGHGAGAYLLPCMHMVDGKIEFSCIDPTAVLYTSLFEKLTTELIQMKNQTKFSLNPRKVLSNVVC